MDALRLQSPDGHQLQPVSPLVTWAELGQLLAAKEDPPALHGDKWVTLRLNACLFGSFTHHLQAAGVTEPGYSVEIGQAMQACCRAIMDSTGADLGYTYSDKIVIVMAPRRKLEGGGLAAFLHNGRVQKCVSTMASVATAFINSCLRDKAAERGIILDEHLVAHFDCRAGVFDSEDEALALVLCGANSCSLDSVQEACLHANAPLGVQSVSLAEKLLWLKDASLLPLDPHQAHGSLFIKGTGQFEAVIPNTTEVVNVTRRVNIQVNDGAYGPRNLLLVPSSGLSLLPAQSDLRMGLRNGSYWRFAGPSGTGEESQGGQRGQRGERRTPRKRNNDKRSPRRKQ
ncbi:unnamed protein product [Polarella glacialis]|uniref:tRNAHis guanylyltransferase catalytic domain-containing protein n=1 Tax=Polarella glacialis TaxID=89957 RepID=A0A813F9Z0_POLGL|nr:unnamed protein product [Polarella glacialis]